ncbi:unnamed protein product [Adineta ricciae]|uniref:Gag-like protein n=1 Tax=Adineta ricciae TaxID=249248 RepID=A0A813QR08_ADIRI|nr:unnamed protein product [Adineta ricciae]CAF1382193.1 unnamed protein product [Adineta ricciae]
MIMSTEDTGNARKVKLVQDNLNEQAEQSNIRKRSIQCPNDGDSSTVHTPKRNRKDTTNEDTRITQCPSKPVQNKQEESSTSTATRSTTSSYFNTGVSHQPKNNSNETTGRMHRESPRQTYPPFRITFQDENSYPTSELSLIKEINKQCKLNLTYGRYTKTSDMKMCFLLYPSTTEQFEYLMCESNWPSMISKTEYKLDLPIKIPSSYSIVIQKVPSQWNAEAFGRELKQCYPSIVRAVRLFISGGRPLSKVRVDFSSYKELSSILKAKRILLDDDNTAFAVEPYVPPTRILRCYNCQAYDVHIAAHCPSKNNPVCFRCAQQHPYNPQCNNPIKCVHCDGDHMAGNPSCPVKLGKRQERNQRMKTPREASSTINQQQRKHTWTGNANEHLFGSEPTPNTTSSTSTLNNSMNYETNILNMFEKIENAMHGIKQKQVELNNKFDEINAKLNYHNDNINQLKYCIYDVLCPLVQEITIQTQSKATAANKKAIVPLYNKLTELISKNNNSSNNMDEYTTNEIGVNEYTKSNGELYQTTTHESRR